MRKNHVQSIIIHTPDGMDFHTLSDRVNGFHAEVIERRLNQSNLTTEQKLAVIDKIIESLKSRESGGVIK